jgi:hypothetical protein
VKASAFFPLPEPEKVKSKSQFQPSVDQDNKATLSKVVFSTPKRFSIMKYFAMINIFKNDRHETNWNGGLLRIFLSGLLLMNGLDINAQTLAEKEKQWRSCELGHYSGPREGRRNYIVDNYIWVVTPEFAKRYCMPEHMVSRDLKGAEAIAFRMVDGADMDACRVDDEGQHNCVRQSRARFEIYLSQSLKLPASNPDVRFYDNRRNTSEWVFSRNKERISRSQRYKKGQYTPPPGTVPRFANLFGEPDSGYTFGLLYQAPGSIPWPTSSLFEVGYSQTVFSGVDLLILEDVLNWGYVRELRFFKAIKADPSDPQGRYLIVMDKRDNETREKRDKRVPEDFEHVIYLPKAFGMQVREVSMKTGNGSLTELINMLPKH